MEYNNNDYNYINTVSVKCFVLLHILKYNAIKLVDHVFFIVFRVS